MLDEVLLAIKMMTLLKFHSIVLYIQAKKKKKECVCLSVNLHNVNYKHITHLAFPQFTGSEFKRTEKTMRQFILVRDAGDGGLRAQLCSERTHKCRDTFSRHMVCV